MQSNQLLNHSACLAFKMTPLASCCSRNVLGLCRQVALRRSMLPAILRTRSFSITASQYIAKRSSSTPDTTAVVRPTSNANLPAEGATNPREVFSELDVLSGLPTPASAVESVFSDGFLLNNGQEIRGDGVFLLNNDVFRWKAFTSKPEVEGVTMKAKKAGVLELDDEVWGVLDVVYPKPDLLIIGTGYRTLLLHPNSRKRIQDAGINVDIMDTHNAAAQYNLLATERPGTQVAAALLTVGFGR